MALFPFAGRKSFAQQPTSTGARGRSGQLATFSFTNRGMGSSSWDEGTSTFAITAIPEPSTYVAAIGLLALMLWPLHRRLDSSGRRGP